MADTPETVLWVPHDRPICGPREPQSQFQAVNTRSMASDCWFSNRMRAGEGDQFKAPEFGCLKFGSPGRWVCGPSSPLPRL